MAELSPLLLSNPSFPCHKTSPHHIFHIGQLIQRNNAQKDASKSYAFPDLLLNSNFLPQGRCRESWDPYAVKGRFSCPDGTHELCWSLSPAGLQEGRGRRVLQTFF